MRSKEAGVGESGDLVFLRLREQLEENPLPFGRGRGIKGCDACSLDLFHIKVQDDGCVISGSVLRPEVRARVILDNQRDWGRRPPQRALQSLRISSTLGFPWLRATTISRASG